MSRRVTQVLQHAAWLVDDEDGVRGYAYASKHRERAGYVWSVDAAVYVDAACRRSGVGRRLYTALFELLRLQGFKAVHAGIALPNDGSVGLDESLGFLPVGIYRSAGFKLGKWIDVGRWQLELSPRTGTPSPPLLGAEARAAWTAALAR